MALETPEKSGNRPGFWSKRGRIRPKWAKNRGPNFTLHDKPSLAVGFEQDRRAYRQFDQIVYYGHSIKITHLPLGQFFIRHMLTRAESEGRSVGVGPDVARSGDGSRADGGTGDQRRAPDDLVRAPPLRPIRDVAGLDRAVAMVGSLLDREDRDPGEQDDLDVLSDLVEKYEAEHHPLPAVGETEMLRYPIEARDVTQARVAADTGIAEPTISAILSGKRGLRRNHVAALARDFKVSPAVFMAV